MPLIRLGIGDVTLPLAPTVVEAMTKATAEMGVKETFRGYCEETCGAYDFLRFAIRDDYKARGVDIADDEIFVSDGAKSDCGNIGDIILAQEAIMEKELGNIAAQIASQPDKKLIMIAGPSSSGKTTFSHRLSIQLLAHGLRPHPIAVDNYFVEREDTPKDEDGQL